MQSVGCCNDGGRISARCVFGADAVQGLKQFRTRKGASTSTLFLALSHFTLKFSSRHSSPWTVLKRRLFSFSLLSVFHFALKFSLLARQFIVDCSQGETTSISFSSSVFYFALKFFSQGSSPWTVLKGRLPFFSLLRVFHFALKFSRGSSPWTVLKSRLQFFLFESFVSRWSSRRKAVHRGLFSRGDFNFFLFFVSFILHWSSPRETVHCGLFSRGNFNFFLFFVSFILHWSSRETVHRGLFSGDFIFFLFIFYLPLKFSSHTLYCQVSIGNSVLSGCSEWRLDSGGSCLWIFF